MHTKNTIDRLSYQIIGCCMEVHKHLGPGLLESVYETCLISELINQGLNVQSQIHVPIQYKGQNLGGLLKLDLVVNDLIIVELKAVETLIPVYKAQLLSYLKLSGKPKGLLVNFNSESIREGLISLVTENYALLP